MNQTHLKNQEIVNQKHKGSLVTVKTDEGNYTGLYQFVDSTGVMIEKDRKLLFFFWNTVFTVKKAY